LSSYQKRTVKLPRLAGGAMRAFASALAIPGLGAMLRQQMIKNVGVDELRQRSTEAPQWTPARLFPPASNVASNGPAAGRPIDLDAIAGAPTERSPPSVARLASALRSGRADVVDVAERVLAAIQESEQSDGDNKRPPFRFFIAHNPDDVRAQARQSAERHRRGAPLSVLDGVPVAVKDEVDQAGYPTTGGTSFLGKSVAAHDSFAVAQLRAAGAVLVGKTNMHEIGLGTTGQNPHHGTPRNPHDPTRHTGGSSSGSGGVVAAGIVPLALGADGGGSIRNPASLCGVVGLKPTFGRVSEHGAVPLCWSVAHLGPIASTVRDCALGYAVMAGADPQDVHSQRQPPVVAPVLDGDVRGLKIGVFRDWIEDSDPDVHPVVFAALSRLQQRGAQLVDIDIADLELLRLVHVVTILIEMAASQAAHFPKQKRDYALDTLINLTLGHDLSATEYVHAQRHRSVICDRFDEVLTKVDAIATPSVGCTAPPVRADALVTGESDIPLLLKIMRFAPAANVTGLPAISVPVGRGQGGLPVGLMLMGRAFDEATVFRLAQAAEEDAVDTAGEGFLKPRYHWRLW
jgi:Asp-tRNA(Asn)/Glu-tRNA(Gln) amidotransferase A subunit family amidase